MGETTDDPVLGSLLKMTIKSINRGVELFPNPLDEPILYSEFKSMVADALDEYKNVRQFEEESRKRYLGGNK